MPRPTKEVAAAKAAAKAAAAAVDAATEAASEKATRKRSVRAATLPKGVPATPEGKVIDGGEMTDEEFDRHESFDEASARRVKFEQDLADARANGENDRGKHFNMSAEEKYADAYKTLGGRADVRVILTRTSHPGGAIDDVSMRPFPALSDVREHVRKKWDGREMDVHWEVRSKRLAAHAQDDFHLNEDLDAQALWAEKRSANEKRERELAIAAAPAANPWAAWGMMTPGGMQTTPAPGMMPGMPPGMPPLPPGFVMTPWGPMQQAQAAAMGVAPPQGAPPDVVTMLAQAALGKGNSDPALLAVITKALETRMGVQSTPAATVQQGLTPEHLIALLEAVKDKPADQGLNTIMLELLKDRIKTPQQTVQQEDPLDRVKKVFELFGGSPFGQQKGSELDDIIAKTNKGKELASALGFKSPGDKEDSDGVIQKKKDGSMDVAGTVVTAVAENIETIGGGFKFLAETGMEWLNKSRADKRKAEQDMIAFRNRGDFVAEERARQQLEIKQRDVDLNERYVRQLKETAAEEARLAAIRSGAADIGVREVTPAAQPAPAPSPAPRSAVARATPATPATTSDDEELPSFFPVDAAEEAETEEEETRESAGA